MYVCMFDVSAALNLTEVQQKSVTLVHAVIHMHIWATAYVLFYLQTRDEQAPEVTRRLAHDVLLQITTEFCKKKKQHRTIHMNVHV